MDFKCDGFFSSEMGFYDNFNVKPRVTPGRHVPQKRESLTKLFSENLGRKEVIVPIVLFRILLIARKNSCS